MGISFMPKTTLGKWSVGLIITFLLLMSIYVISVFVLKINIEVSDWWNSTPIIAFLNLSLLIAFPASVAAFITGIIAIKKKDHSVLVYSSVVIGLLTILFLLLHSLFIND